MRPTHLIAVLALAAGSAACTGSLDTTPSDDSGDDSVDPPGAARQQFESTIAPMLSACSGCHTGAIDQTPLKWLGAAGATGYYPAVTGEESVVGGFDPDLANLLLKGAHDGGNARAWTDEEKATIADWLVAEAAERGIDLGDNGGLPPGETTPTTSREALAQWSGCMSIDDWRSSLVFQWADKSTERGDCKSCHNNGAGGYYASADDDLMFEMNRFEIYITTFFTAAPKDITNPALGYEVKVNEQKLRSKANATGHPSFNPDGGEQMQYLYNFYDLTNARIAAGTCGPAGFPTTPPAP